MVKDINPGANGSSPRNLTVVNGAFEFYASDGTDWGLFRSDGTTAGTVEIATHINDLLTGIGVTAPAAADFTNAGTSDVLLANDTGSGVDWLPHKGSHQTHNPFTNSY